MPRTTARRHDPPPARCPPDGDRPLRGALILSACVALACSDAIAGPYWGGRIGEGYATAIKPTSDGGCVASGTGYVGPDFGGFVVKVDASGQTQWYATAWDDVYQTIDDVTEVEGGYIAVGRYDEPGTAGYRGWVVKLDRAGRVAWQRTYGAPRQAHWKSIVTMTDGDVAIAGQAIGDVPGKPGYAVLALHPNGDVRWMTGLHRQEGTGGGGTTIGSLAPTADGGVLLGTGVLESRGPLSNIDAGLIKLDARGQVEWQRAYGLPAPRTEIIEAVVPGDTGDLVAIGVDWDDAGPQTSFVMGLDAAGRTRWLARWVGIAPDAIVTSSVAARIGGFVVAHALNEALGTRGSVVAPIAVDGTLAGARLLPDEFVAAAAGAPAGGFFLAGDGCFVAHLDDASQSHSRCITERSFPLSTAALSFVEQPVDHAWEPVTPTILATTAVVEVFPHSPPCPRVPCAPLSCDAIVVGPAAPCSAADVQLDLATSGGQVVGVDWDVDGDGIADVSGNPARIRLPAGPWTVTAHARDECPDGAQECFTSMDVVVADLPPVPEVSDVTRGAPPLLVTRDPGTLTVEAVPGAVSYAAFIGRIGAWTSPTAADGSECSASWWDNGDGTATLDVWPDVNTWFVVAASNGCTWGTAGTTSLGDERGAAPTWLSCP